MSRARRYGQCDQPNVHDRPALRGQARRRAPRPLPARSRRAGDPRRLPDTGPNRVHGMARAGRARPRARERAGEDRTRWRRRAGDHRRVNILGFDTSTAATTACLLRSDGEAFEFEPPPGRLLEPPTHARELMSAIDHVMGEAGVTFADVDALAVGIGPGGFTGLRIGIATAHGIAQGAGIDLRPVP